MDPCGDLTDVQYLQHMIPHHQVAINMSRALQHSSRWPELLAMARQIIWTQDLEIKLMHAILLKFMHPISESNQKYAYISRQGDWTYPNSLDIVGSCDPMFFHPMQHEHISDKDYITHMMPHHQVAVDMSKRLLIHTRNDYMIDLAYSIIRAQQAEIAKLNALEQTKQNMIFQSSLI